MSPEPATSVESAMIVEPMAPATESMEKAVTIDEEKGIRVVPVAVRRVVVVAGITVVVAVHVVVRVVAGIPVRVAAAVAVVVAFGVRILGARTSRVLVGAVSNLFARALPRSSHVDGRHVAHDQLADSRIPEPSEIAVAQFRRKLQAVRLGVGEDRYVRGPSSGHADEIVEERSGFARRRPRVL